MVPEGLQYTREHEWVRVSENVAAIGITYHAQSELGDITFVDLPSTGSMIEKGSVIATIESVKAASDVYSPISGKVIEVNADLGDAPEKINVSPYEKGWICRLEITDPSGLEGLMDSTQYGKFIEK